MVTKVKTVARSRFPTLYTRLAKLKQKFLLSNKNIAELFGEYYKNNTWGDAESISGPGSRLDRTEQVRTALPAIVKSLDCHSVLDIPCGDYNWMRLVEWDVEYIGADIVDDLIHRNQESYQDDRHKFATLDITKDKLPKVDLVICRDCLVHLSYSNIFRAFANLKSSNSTYLLTTTFTSREMNTNIVTGEWRAINLQKKPFGLSEPILLVDDTFPSQNYFDKHLGLWKISDLPAQ